MAKHLLCKCEELSSNRQTPHIYEHAGLCLHHSALKAAQDVEMGEFQEAHGLLRLDTWQ